MFLEAHHKYEEIDQTICTNTDLLSNENSVNLFDFHDVLRKTFSNAAVVIDTKPTKICTGLNEDIKMLNEIKFIV